MQKKFLQTEVPNQNPPNLGDVVTGAQNGGGVVGALTGLANYMGSSQGKQILAGLGSGHMAQGMLNQAEIQREREVALQQAAVQQEMQRRQNVLNLLQERAKNQTELQKTMNPEILKILTGQFTGETAANVAAKKAEAAKSQAETGAVEPKTQQESEKIAYGNRNWWEKLWGEEPQKMVAKNSMGHTIVSYDKGQTWQ